VPAGATVAGVPAEPINGGEATHRNDGAGDAGS